MLGPLLMIYERDGKCYIRILNCRMTVYKKNLTWRGNGALSIERHTRHKGGSEMPGLGLVQYATNLRSLTPSVHEYFMALDTILAMSGSELDRITTFFDSAAKRSCSPGGSIAITPRTTAFFTALRS